MIPVTDIDRELVNRAQAGQFEAFDRLVAKYERQIYTLALRIVRNPEDAEEVVQETFLSVIQNLSRFRQEAKFYSWLVRIATNQALKVLRRRKRQTTVSFDSDSDAEDLRNFPKPEYIADWKDTPERIAQQRETQALLDQALEQLDEKYRLVFLLRDIEQLPTEETAKALKISPSNVKVRLLRARLMLREKLTRIFGDESTRLFAGSHPHP